MTTYKDIKDKGHRRKLATDLLREAQQEKYTNRKPCPHNSACPWHSAPAFGEVKVITMPDGTDLLLAGTSCKTDRICPREYWTEEEWKYARLKQFIKRT